MLYEKKVFYLMASGRCFFAETSGAVTVLVAEECESTYVTRTWRLIAARSDELEDGYPSNVYLEKSSEGKRSTAAIDRKSGWVFVAGVKGLRSWNSQKMRETARYPAIKGPCVQVAIDNSQRLLYTLEAHQLRAWKIKE